MFQRCIEIYRSGELGAIEHIDAAFHIPVTEPDSIRMNYALGGGVTMDIGCYPISWARHLTGDEPESVAASAEVGPAHVDVMLRTEMTFPGGIRVTTAGDMRAEAGFKAYLNVRGSRGEMRVTNPLVPQIGHSIEVIVDGQSRTEVLDRRATYSYQLDALLAAINEGARPATDGVDGVKQMQVIDRAYEAAGLPVRGLPL